MHRLNLRWTSFAAAGGVWLPVIGAVGVLLVCPFLRTLSISPDPLFVAQLQFTSGVLAATFAGAAFVRFRGTHERLPLVLAVGFAIVGITLASSSLASSSLSPSETTASLRDPITWVIGRTLLAILLVSALLVHKSHGRSDNPNRDITIALVLTVLVSMSLSIMHRYLPSTIVVQPGRLFPRPGNLIPAIFFLFAAFSYHHRLKRSSASFDISLYLAAVINFWCSLAAAQSDRRLDSAFALAEVLQFVSYAVIVGGALVDNIHLFREIQNLALTDPVTGLANYRRLINSIETEMQRSGRTGRPFALLLFDLDGLKKINDKFGHQVGTRALCRAADVLRLQCRGIDVSARQGGDEFALVLPETTSQGADEVLRRVCDRVATDGERPPISLSAGFAIYPGDGNTAEMLMNAADLRVYRMKAQQSKSKLQQFV